MKKKMKGINRLFSKTVVVWCILAGTGASLWSLRILSNTGHDGAALLGVILAFFGGELVLLFGRDALKKGDGKDDES